MPATLRALLFGGAASAADLAKAAVNLQLTTWEIMKAEAVLRQDNGVGKLADLDFGWLKFVGMLGENAKEDVEVILGAMGKGVRGLGREFWTWEQMLYAVRCTGLAVTKDVAEWPKKKTRVDAGEQLLADVDEWYDVASSHEGPCFVPDEICFRVLWNEMYSCPPKVFSHTVCQPAGSASCLFSLLGSTRLINLNLFVHKLYMYLMLFMQ